MFRTAKIYHLVYSVFTVQWIKFPTHYALHIVTVLHEIETLVTRAETPTSTSPSWTRTWRERSSATS